MTLAHPFAAREGRPSWAKLTPGSRRQLALGAVVVLALALRLLRLGFQPLWWDEGWSVYFATTTLDSMARLTAVDIHPPLYYALLHLWTALFGASPIAARLLSVLAGTAAVPLLYLAARRLAGAKAGLLAALLLSISPFAVYYSQEVRMYGLVTLLGLAAFYFALKMVDSAWSVVPWLGYVLAAGAALYTQYYAGFLLLALNLAVIARWLARRHSFRAWLPWLSAQAAALLLFLPWLLYAGNKLLTYVRYKVGVEEDAPIPFLRYLGRHLAAFDWGHAEGGLTAWWWVGLVPLALLAACLFLSIRLRSRRRRAAVSAPAPHQSEGNGLLLACALIVLGLVLGGFVVNLLFPFTAPRIERQLLLALPYFLILVAAALFHLWRRRMLLALLPLASFVLVAILSLAFFYTVPRYADDDYRPLASRVAALARPDDALVAVHPWQIGYFESYLPGDRRPELVLSPREVLPEERQYWADDPALMASDLDRLLARNGRLWFPAHQSMGRVLEDQMDAFLVEHAYPVLTQWYGDTTVLTLFSAGQTENQPLAARLGDWLSLDGAALGAGPVEAGWGVVPVDLAWKLVGPPGAAYTVGLRLVDAAGRVWAQRDSEPQGGRDPFTLWPVGTSRLDRLGLLVPAGTPPGRYRLTLRVYRTADLAPLPAVQDGRGASEVPLGTVQVVRPGTPPAVEAMPIGVPLERDAGPLRLLGYTLRSTETQVVGEVVEVDLFWQALSSPGEDFFPRLQLLDETGTVQAELAEKPVAGTYPTAWWAAGELVRDPHALTVPAAAPAGRYRLVLSLLRAADGRPVSMGAGRTSVDLAGIRVQGREHNYARPAPQHVQQFLLGDSVELVGYDLGEAALAPSSPMSLTLYWHALATPDKSYRSFVHLLDANGQIVAQDDGIPGQGKLPSLGWLPGEYLADPRALLMPSGLPEGEYRLEVGLYDPVTDLRLGERVLLETTLRVSAAAP